MCLQYDIEQKKYSSPENIFVVFIFCVCGVHVKCSLTVCILLCGPKSRCVVPSLTFVLLFIMSRWRFGRGEEKRRQEEQQERTRKGEGGFDIIKKKPLIQQCWWNSQNEGGYLNILSQVELWNVQSVCRLNSVVNEHRLINVWIECSFAVLNVCSFITVFIQL